LLTRNDVSKQIIEYLKGNDCQNQEDKREFFLDDPLKTMFKVDTITYFSINKYIGLELTDQNPDAVVKKSRKRKASTTTTKGGSKKKSKKGSKKGSKKEEVVKDPNKPKRGLSAFMFYSSERRKKLKETQPELAFGDVAKTIGAEWQKMSDSKKKKFNERAAKDKERYTLEMSTYVPPENLGGNKKKRKR
jgi:hypothetical protein